jgi:hypothetical protein
MAMAVDEMLQLLVNLVQLEAELADQGEEFLLGIRFAFLLAGHVEVLPTPALIRLAHDAFGETIYRPLPLCNRNGESEWGLHEMRF